MTILDKMAASKEVAENPAMNMFIENYVDLLENSPIQLSLKISRIHEMNVHRFRLSDSLEQQKQALGQCESEEEKIKIMENMIQKLLQMQNLTDVVNEHTQYVFDEVDHKTRVLDSQWRMYNNSVFGTVNYQNPTSYSNSSSSAPTPHHNGSFKEPAEKKREKKEEKECKNEPKEEKEEPPPKKHKDKEPKNSKSNSVTRGNRRTGSKKEQDSKDGSSEDRSSTPVASTTEKATKRGTKRASKSSKHDGSKRRGSTNYDSGSEYKDKGETDEPTYCICEQVSFGEMVCCDNPNCSIEWFHFVCVSLTSNPKGRWYCPNCRGDRSNVQKK